MLALLALAVYTHDVAAGHHAGFALASAMLGAILVVLYARAYRHAPVAYPLIRRYASIYALSVVLWFVSAWLPAEWALVLWPAAVLLDLSMLPLSTKLHRAILTDPAHSP